MSHVATLDGGVAGSEQWASGVRRRRFGQRLGRYQLGTLLGSGGAASVYMARLDGPHGFERVLALKLVHEHLLTDRDFVTMFLDEANLAAELQHPSIVHTYELCQDHERLYLAMEYLQGQPLSCVYRRALSANRPLPYALVAWLGARAAEALAYAHAALGTDGEPLRIVHRDVSPDNLFISYDGQLKLLDFGIARAARRLSQTNLGQIKGKVAYMAPEYALGQEFDGALDLFALGATLYEAALGKPAFDGDEQAVVRRILLGEVQDPRELRPDFPPRLWQILQGMLEPDPKARSGPAASVARELDAEAGLSFAQGRALLALTMDRLFPEEKLAAAEDLSELRALRGNVLEHTEHSHVLGERLAPPSTPRASKRVLIAASLVAVSSAVWAIARPDRPLGSSAPTVDSPPAVQASRPAQVEIAVTVTPADAPELRVAISGVEVPARAARLLVARGALPLTVRVTASGFAPIEVSVVPDAARSLVLALAAAPAPTAAAQKPALRDTPRAAIKPSGVIKRYPF